MSDDFGTVSARRGDRTREIEVLRQHYRQHRDALNRMASEAPSEHLANEYVRLVRDIEASLAKLDEIEGRAPSAAAAAATSAGTAAAAARAARPEMSDPDLHMKTEPGTRPLVTPPSVDATYDTQDVAPSAGPSRVPLIIVAGLVVLALIGYLIWRASSDRRAPDTIVESTAPVTPVTETETGTVMPVTPAPRPAATATVAPAAAAGGLSITPVLADYGTIRKGTRAARQFEVVNNTGGPVQIQVARSQCRCLFYEYRDKLDAGKKETITVTIDGARVKGTTVAETVPVTLKGNKAISTSFQVQADIQ